LEIRHISVWACSRQSSSVTRSLRYGIHRNTSHDRDQTRSSDQAFIKRWQITFLRPPPFRLNHRLSDWAECWLEMKCPKCNGRQSISPIKLIIAKHGERTFLDLIRKLRCSVCGELAAPVYLCASASRTGGHGGAPPNWAIEIVPENGRITWP
jgi:phage FluMu protein Com